LQVRAADIILNHAARAVETVDLAERIERLEAAIEQVESRRKGIRAI